MSSKWENNIGKILLSKGEKLYIKIDKEVSLQPDDVITLVKKTDDIDNKVERGFLTPEQGQAEKEKLHFVKYVLNKAPRT